MKIENYSAFPVAIPDDHQNCVEGFIQHGLSKREYFAVKAMQGMLSDIWPDDQDKKMICKHAVRLADELLAQLESK